MQYGVLQADYKGQKLDVRVTHDMQIRAFFDAAFALHHDSKSHSVVMLLWEEWLYMYLQESRDV